MDMNFCSCKENEIKIIAVTHEICDFLMAMTCFQRFCFLSISQLHVSHLHLAVMCLDAFHSEKCHT